MTEEMNPVKKDAWKIRRKVVLWTLFFCAVCVGKIVMYGGGDPATNQAALYALCTLAGGTIGSYVFGATWHDNNMKNG